MIAKRVPSPKGKNTVVKLVNYIANPDKQVVKEDSGEKGVENLVSYMGRDDAKAQVRITNCVFDDPTVAVKEIQAVQKKNTRSTKEKTYHLVISFQEGERPSNEILQSVENHIVEKIGYADHQRISALHTNTNNWHIHIAINKVHPQSFRNVEPYYDKMKMLEACRELEEKFGLKQDQGATLFKKTKIIPAQDMESHSGIKSLVTWINENAQSSLDEILKSENPSWEKLHDVLNDFGLTIRKRGAGLILQNIEDGIAIKASSIGREFSKGKLEKILGPFQENENTTLRDPKKKYIAEPLQSRTKESETLWNQYIKEKEDFSEKRNESFEKLREERKEYLRKRLQTIKDRKQEAQQSAILRYRQKRNIYAALQIERMEVIYDAKKIFGLKSDSIKQDFPAQTWTAFLQKEAETGNEEALKLLRRNGRNTDSTRNSFQGIDSGSSPYQEMTYQVDKRGRIKYQTESGYIMDTGLEVIPGSEETEILRAGITIAIGRFGRKLRVKGDPSFIQKIKEIAIEQRLNVNINGEELKSRREKRRGTER